MRYMKPSCLLTGICFCITGCISQGGNQKGPHYLSDGLEAWECYLAGEKRQIGGQGSTS